MRTQSGAFACIFVYICRQSRENKLFASLGGKIMAEKNIMTRAGLQKVEEKLEYLKVVRRPEISEKLQEARAQGDLSENAEYDATMDEQRDLEAEIASLEELIKNVEVVEADEVAADIINVGCRVRVLAVSFGSEMEFAIVGSNEADSLKGKISPDSPIGKALMGKRTGDQVEVETPAGTQVFEVLDIWRDEN